MGGAGAGLVSVRYKEVLASATAPEKLSAIRRFLKYSWYIAHCPLYGRCPLFGVSAKRGSTIDYYTYIRYVWFHCIRGCIYLISFTCVRCKNHFSKMKRDIEMAHYEKEVK